MALAALKQSFRVVVRLEHARVPVQVNERCQWMKDSSGKPNPTRAANVGQLASHEQCLSMIREYEAKHGVAFTHVLKARPDAAWPQSAPPWCSLDQRGIYVAHPQPHDWFMYMPRTFQAISSSVLLRRATQLSD